MPRKGLPKAIIKKYGITKKAWRVHKADLARKRGGSRTSRTRRSSPTSRRTGVRRLARRRYTRRRGRRNPRTIPVLPFIGLGVGLVEPISYLRDGDFGGAALSLSRRYLGYNIHAQTFSIEDLAQGWVPLIVGALGHKAANMIGLNRMFARLPSPLNKLRL